MPSEAVKIRSYLTECRERFGGSLDRPTKGLVRGAARLYDQLLDDHHDRYPFELLQNAHDACAGQADRSGKISFVWSNEALHVSDNGEGFFEANVEALCALGNTTKLGEKGSIGYKGIGFVSVYELTDTPQILTHHGVNFGFNLIEARKNQRPPMLLPDLLEDSDLGSDGPLIERLRKRGAKTIIRLPFRPTDQADESYRRLLEVMRPEALIFMPKIGDLEFRFGGECSSWSCKQLRRNKVGPGTFYRLAVAGETKDWLMAQKSVPTPQEILTAPGWSESKRLGAAVAIPWSNGRPVPSSTNQAIYAYYPTEEKIGSGFLIHGDFQVNTNRKRLVPTSPVTKVVRDLAIDVAVDLFEAVAGQGKKASVALLDLLGEVGPVGVGFPQMLRTKLFERLAEVPLVPTRRGRALKPSGHCLILEFNRDDLDVDQAGKFIDLMEVPSEFADPCLLSKKACETLVELGSRPAGGSRVAFRVKPTGNDLPGVVLLLREWVDQLHPREKALFLNRLEKRPVVLDAESNWRPASDVILGGGLPKSVAKVLDLTFAQDLSDPELRSFLEASLGVRSLDTKFAVERTVELSNRASGTSLQDQLFGVLKSIWSRDPEGCAAALGSVDLDEEFLWHGYDNDNDNEYDTLDEENVAESPLPSLQLPVKTLRGDTTGRRPLGRGIYFRKSWSDTTVAEKFFGRFGRAEFLDLQPPGDNEEFERDKALLEALGVKTYPVIRRHFGHPLEQWWSYFRTIESQVSKNCPANGHPKSGLRSNIYLPELIGEIVTDPRKGSSGALLELLDVQTVLDGWEFDSVTCGHGSHPSGDWVYNERGYMNWLLSREQWVPFGKRYLAPAECWHGLPKQNKRLQLPEAPDGLAQLKGVPTCDYKNPGAASLVSALQLLRKTHQDPEEDTAFTADWLTRELARKESLPTGKLVLLAHSPKGRVWVDDSDDMVVWDLPGFAEALPGLSTPVIFDIDEEEDLSSLARPEVVSLASKTFDVQVDFADESDPVSTLTGDEVCGIVARTPTKWKKYIARCLTAMVWRTGEGLSLRFVEDGKAVGATNEAAAYLSVTDSPDSQPPDIGDLENFFAKHRLLLAGPDDWRAGELTMHVDTGASPEDRREGIADELLRMFPPGLRGTMGISIELILTQSKKRWMKRLKIGEQKLADTREFIDEATELPIEADELDTEDRDEEAGALSEGGAEVEGGATASAPSEGRGEPAEADSGGKAPPAHSPGGATDPKPSGKPGGSVVPREAEDEVDAPIRFPAEGAVPTPTDDDEAASEKTPARRASGGRSQSETAAISGEIEDEFKSPADKMRSEQASIATARLVLERLGAKGRIHDERKKNLGWDLRCQIDGREQYVEVKSTRKKSSFPMTRNEREKLKKHKSNYMVIFVSNISGNPHKVRVICGLHEVAEQFKVKDYSVTQSDWEQADVTTYDIATNA